MTPHVPHGPGPARPDTALVFLGKQRRKNNRKSDHVRNGNIFAACAFLGKIRKPFLPPNVGGEGLKPHGGAASTGEAERGAEPGARPTCGGSCVPKPGWAARRPQTLPSCPAPREQRGSGSGLGRRRGWGSCLKVSQL